MPFELISTLPPTVTLSAFTLVNSGLSTTLNVYEPFSFFISMFLPSSIERPLEPMVVFSPLTVSSYDDEPPPLPPDDAASSSAS